MVWLNENISYILDSQKFEWNIRETYQFKNIEMKSWFYIKCVTFGVVNAFARTEYKVQVVGYRFLQSKMKYLQSC